METEHQPTQKDSKCLYIERSQQGRKKNQTRKRGRKTSKSHRKKLEKRDEASSLLHGYGRGIGLHNFCRDTGLHHRLSDLSRVTGIPNGCIIPNVEVSDFQLFRKLRMAIALLEEIYNSPQTGDANKTLIEKGLKKIHGKKPAQRTSKSRSD